MRRKIFASILALCMVVSLLPMTAFAANVTEIAVEVSAQDTAKENTVDLKITLTGDAAAESKILYQVKDAVTEGGESKAPSAPTDADAAIESTDIGSNGTWKEYTVTAPAGSMEITATDGQYVVVAYVEKNSDGNYDIVCGNVSEEVNDGYTAPSSTPVTGVTVAPKTLSLKVGGTGDLTATVAPSNATNQKVTWSSDKTDIATVNESGKVSAVAEGTATITATTEDGSKTDTCAVTVSAAETQKTALTTTMFKSIADKTYTGEAIEPAVEPAEGTDNPTSSDYTVTYSNNTNVGTAKAIVTAKTDSAKFTGSVEIPFTITKKTISITSADIANKQYDGETTATVNSVTFGSDSLTKDTDYTATATFENANVGTAKAVTVEVALKGDALKNYTLENATYTDATANITSKQITASVKFDVTLNDSGVLGEGAKLKAVVTPTGVVEGEKLGYSYAWTVGSDSVTDGVSGDTYTVKNGLSGDVKVVVTLDNTTAANTNYEITTSEVSTTATLGSAGIKVTGFSDAPEITKEYDGTTEYSGNTAGLTLAFANAKTNEAISEAVTATIESITFNSADVAGANSVTVVVTISGTDYVLASGGDTFTYNTAEKVSITPKAIVASDITIAEATYTGSEVTPDVTVTVGGKELEKDTDYTLTYVSATNVGDEGSVTVKGIGNYSTDASGVTKTFTLEKGTPALSSNEVSVTVGSKQTVTVTTDASEEITVSGANEEIATVAVNEKAIAITGVAKGTTNVTVNVPAGTNYAAATLEIAVTVTESTTNQRPGGDNNTTPVEPDPDPDPTPGEDVTETVTPTVSEGTASATVNQETADKIVSEAVDNKSENVTVKVDVPSDADVNEVKAELPASAVADLASKTDANLTVDTPVANVTIPNESLSQLGASSGNVTVTATVGDDNTVTVEVQRNGTTLGALNGGMKVDLPAAETTTGTVAVLVNADGTETIIPKSVVNGDEVAVLLENGSATIKLVDNSKQFDDMGSHWAKDAAAFTSSRNLFKGVSDTQFAADTAMSRAMLATVLYRMENEPAVSGGSFADVPAESYYADAAAWAAGKGIVTGDGTGFNGDRDITREEMAVMFYRYIQTINGNKGTLGSYSHMTDASQVSSWASEAMRWAVGSGVMKGTNTGALNPKGSATRGEVSQMVMNFVQLITK